MTVTYLDPISAFWRDQDYTYSPQSSEIILHLEEQMLNIFYIVQYFVVWAKHLLAADVFSPKQKVFTY